MTRLELQIKKLLREMSQMLRQPSFNPAKFNFKKREVERLQRWQETVSEDETRKELGLS